MENFIFFNPTRIEFGTGKEQLIGQHLAAYGIRIPVFGIAETYTPEVVTAILNNAL